MKKYLITSIREIVTEESAENGEIDRYEYLLIDEEMDITEVINEINNGSWELCNSYKEIWLNSIDSEVDYLTGDQITYSLFIEGLKRDELKRVKEHNKLYINNL